MRPTQHFAAFSALACMFAAGTAHAADTPVCTVGQYASLPMEAEPDGAVTVSVSINGQPARLVVDTGSIISSLTYVAANELGLKQWDSPFQGEFVNGIRTSRVTHVDSIAMGGASLRKSVFLLAPYTLLNANVSGLLGPDILSNFDVEFDFAAGAMHLLAPNTCAVAPVYWTHQPYAEVAMTLDQSMHITVPAQLDGKAVVLAIDTGSARSTMTFETARELFNLAENDSRMKVLPPQRINRGEPVSMWRYPFSSLIFEGIQVANPDIDIIPERNFGGHESKIVIGMSVLRQLHIYIGYKAQKLYVTAAEAR
ncbi:MAG: aspartyl protease family protein [Rhizomicrobium sp.]|jgi:predicted aspartyl protease